MHSKREGKSRNGGVQLLVDYIAYYHDYHFYYIHVINPGRVLFSLFEIQFYVCLCIILWVWIYGIW